MTVSVEYPGYNGHIYITTSSKILELQKSYYDEYIHIEQPQERLQVDTTAVVQIYCKPPRQERMVFYEIFKKGYLLLKEEARIRQGDSNILINLPITSRMSPSVNMIAYYVTEADEPKVIGDRVVLYIEEVCVGEEPDIFVTNLDDELPLPGAQLDLEVTAERGSIVSMNGGDEALHKIKATAHDEVLLTRKTLYKILDTPENYCTNKQFIGTTYQSRYCSPHSNRQRRSLIDSSTNNLIIESAFRYPGIMYDCCLVGSRDVSSVYPENNNVSCDSRMLNLNLVEGCAFAFKDCCKLAECVRRNPNQREVCTQSREVLTDRSISSSSTFQLSLPYSDTVRNSFVVERSLQLRRRNFNPTWFFVDFEISSSSGRKVLNNYSNPRVTNLPDTNTRWKVDAVTLSKKNGICIGAPFYIPVQHSLFIEVDVSKEPVLVGTQVSVEVTIYNYLDVEVEVKVYLEGVKGLCSSAKPGSSSEPARHNLAQSLNNEPTSRMTRFVIIPFNPGIYNIQVKMVANYENTRRPTIDQVEKVLAVVPEGEMNKKIEWILIDTRSTGSTLRRRRRGRKSFHIRIPDNAIPGSEKISVSVHSLPSASLYSPKENGTSPATIQHILYQLHPAISKLEYFEMVGILDSKRKDKYLQKIEEHYIALLTYTRSVPSMHFISGNGISHGMYGFSYSPASNSEPNMKLTSSILAQLYKMTKFMDIDEKILRGGLHWLFKHQKNIGYFSTSVDSQNLKRTPKTERGKKKKKKKGAIYPSDSLQMKNTDRKIYLTSVTMLDLISIKKNVERILSGLNSSSHLYPDYNHDGGILAEVIGNGKTYLERKLIEDQPPTKCYSAVALAVGSHVLYRLTRRRNLKLDEALNRWRRVKGSDEYNQDEAKWIETCTYSMAEETVDLGVSETNAVEATAHALQLAILQGYRGDGYATWLLYKRNVNGHWYSLRATLSAMNALKHYTEHLYNLNMNDSVPVEVQNSLSSNITIEPAKVSDDPSQTKLKTVNPVVPISTRGVGRSWIKLEIYYHTPSETKEEAISSKKVKSRNGRSLESSSCIYDVSVKMTVEDLISPFIISRAAQPSRHALLISLKIQIENFYADNPEYQSYVIDFGLPLQSKPFETDLEKLFNPIEHILDHYRLSQRSLFLYMTGNKEIKFRLTDTLAKDQPIPIKIYPLSAPETSCSLYYNFPRLPSRLVTFCSDATSGNDRICSCAIGETCPTFIKSKKSAKISLDRRRARTCGDKSTFAYRVLLKKRTKIDSNWYLYEGEIKSVFRSTNGDNDSLVGETHSFWMKTSCKAIPSKQEYLIIGHVVMTASNGKFKHLLDSDTWLEIWTSDSGGCSNVKKKNRKACVKMREYEYTLVLNPCS